VIINKESMMREGKGKSWAKLDVYLFINYMINSG